MTNSTLSNWRQRLRSIGTVRMRTTAIAIVVVGIALVIAAIGIVLAVRRSLTTDLRSTLDQRAVDVASALAAGVSPDNLSLDEGDDSIIQVVNSAGQVVASSPHLRGEPAVAELTNGQAVRVDELPPEDEEFLIVAAQANTAQGQLTVLAGRTVEGVEGPTKLIATVLLIGVPCLVLLVGVTTWRLVGRALTPVEEIRAEVDAISTAELHRRVPEPLTKDEIGRLAITMNRMLERLETTHTRQRQFVSDASHELRSPIATIRQYAEVALAHPEYTSVSELANVVLAEDVRLAHLVEDLLILARADEHQLNVNPRPVDLDDVVFAEASRLRASTSLQIDTSGVSAGRVMGEGAQLRRLVQNLIENAAQHATSRVRLSLTEVARSVVLTVEDDGPGIPRHERGRVFERFVRLDEARTRLHARQGEGSGLGLAIVAEIAKAHHGTVTVTDSKLGGAQLTVRWVYASTPRLHH